MIKQLKFFNTTLVTFYIVLYGLKKYNEVGKQLLRETAEMNASSPRAEMYIANAVFVVPFDLCPMFRFLFCDPFVE